MTITGYTNAIVGLMLGWLKGLANWVLRLFNLAGSVRISPLAFLSRNWLKLLIVFMIIGVAVDVLVWLVRWRPHWVWFRRERVIVSDERFFSDEGLKSEDEWEEDLDKNWHERDYVVASTVVRRKPRDLEPSTMVRRRNPNAVRRDVTGPARREKGEGIGNPEAEKKARRMLKERESDLKAREGAASEDTYFYEDKVFDLSDLPRTDVLAGQEFDMED